MPNIDDPLAALEPYESKKPIAYSRSTRAPISMAETRQGAAAEYNPNKGITVSPDYLGDSQTMRHEATHALLQDLLGKMSGQQGDYFDTTLAPALRGDSLYKNKSKEKAMGESLAYGANDYAPFKQTPEYWKWVKGQMTTLRKTDPKAVEMYMRLVGPDNRAKINGGK